MIKIVRFDDKGNAIVTKKDWELFSERKCCICGHDKWVVFKGEEHNMKKYYCENCKLYWYVTKTKNWMEGVRFDL